MLDFGKVFHNERKKLEKRISEEDRKRFEEKAIENILNGKTTKARYKSAGDIPDEELEKQKEQIKNSYLDNMALKAADTMRTQFYGR